MILYSDASDVMEVRAGSDRRRSDLMDALEIRRSVGLERSWRAISTDSPPFKY